MSHAVTRRAASLAGLGMMLPWVRKASAAPRQITVVAFSGIFEDHYKAAVITPFMRANPDIIVNYSGMPTSAQMLGTLRAQKAAPQTDVCMMDVVVAKAGGDDGIFAPVTAAELPVMKQLMPRALIPAVPGPAVSFDTVVLLYAPQTITARPTSWNELLRKDLAGQIAVDAPPNTAGVGLTIIADKMAGGTDYTKSLDKGIQWLARMAPQVQTWEPKPDCYSLVISGGCALSVGFNARAQVFSGQTPDRLAVSLPDEGSVFQINTLNLVKGSPDPEAALRFMTYALGAEAQKAFTESMFYAPTNAEAVIAPAAMAKTVSSEARMARMIDVDWIKVAAMRDRITEQWRRNVISIR